MPDVLFLCMRRSILFSRSSSTSFVLVRTDLGAASYLLGRGELGRVNHPYRLENASTRCTQMAKTVQKRQNHLLMTLSRMAATPPSANLSIDHEASIEGGTRLGPPGPSHAQKSTERKKRKNGVLRVYAFVVSPLQHPSFTYAAINVKMYPIQNHPSYLHPTPWNIQVPNDPPNPAGLLSSSQVEAAEHLKASYWRRFHNSLS